MVGNMRKVRNVEKDKGTGGSPHNGFLRTILFCLFVCFVRTILKQPEKNALRDPGEKGWACYYCGKEGHLKWDCPQVSRSPLLLARSARDYTGGETAPRGVGFRGQTLKTIRTEGALGSPHKLPY